MLSLLPLMLSAAADPLTGAALRSTIQTYAPHASHPLPALTDDQVERLLSGRVVKMRLSGRGEAPDAALALVVSEHPRADLWMGSMDDHFGAETDLLVHHLPLAGDELFRWYGFVDLPAPFSDRHFLIRTTINRSLSAASQGTMWERSWRLEPGWVDHMRPKVAAGEVDGLTAEVFEAAVPLPVNLGAWILLDLPDGRTLFGYYVATSLGGEIPDGLVTRYVFRGLDRVMATVQERAALMPEHYTAGHTALTGGDSAPIPRY